MNNSEKLIFIRVFCCITVVCVSTYAADIFEQIPMNTTTGAASLTLSSPYTDSMIQCNYFEGTIQNFKSNIDSIRAVMPDLLELFHIAFYQTDKTVKNEMAGACENLIYCLNTLTKNLVRVHSSFYSLVDSTDSISWNSSDQLYQLCKQEPHLENDAIFCLYIDFLVAAGHLENVLSSLSYTLNQVSVEDIYLNKKTFSTLLALLKKTDTMVYGYFKDFDALSYKIWYLSYFLYNGIELVP